jgi:hypothetical protein
MPKSNPICKLTVTQVADILLVDGTLTPQIEGIGPQYPLSRARTIAKIGMFSTNRSNKDTVAGLLSHGEPLRV